MQQHYPNPLGNAILAALIFMFLPTLLVAQETVQGIIRIKVSESLATKLEQTNLSRTRSGEVFTGIQSLDQFSRQFQVRQFKRVFPYAGRHEARHRRYGLHLWYEVRMNKNIPVTSAIQSYRSDKQILRAEPVYQKAIIGARKSYAGPHIANSDALNTGAPLHDASNDPLLASQWHYNNTGQTKGKPGADIKLFEAWKEETGSPDVIVAVTDGGIQTDHPDLAANMWVNPGEISENNIDDDNNGYVDDVHGYGFVNDSGNIIPHDHGTHVAGTLAAVSNNGIGVAGIAGGSGNGDGIRLMSCAVFSYDSIPNGFAEAYVYSADNGAIISQNSWGYTLPGVFEQVVLEAIDYFIAEAGKDESGQQTGPMNGGLAIFSSGNFNDEGNYYPSYYEPVVAVASTNHKDIRAHYANYGAWVDISAPGGETDVTDVEGVISTLPNSQYGASMGTSMACPHVSGVAALILSKYGKPGMRPDAVRARLLRSVDDIYSLNPGYAGKLGSGRLNAALALRDGDAAGPQAVDDLKVENTDVGEITLAWTSPPDEGDFVAEYDLRYATSPITIANFSEAIRVENVPAPKPPGIREQFTVKDLPGGIMFYFAIRSVDFEGNPSLLSNVISQVSASTPVIAVTPVSIEESLQTNGRSERSFTIRNEGEGLLKFSLDAGDETSRFAHLEQRQGQLAPGAEEEITLIFDASGRHAGTYKQDIIITSNDPASKDVAVQLTLNVTGNGAPIASLEADSIDFKSVQVGQTSFRNAGISNAGADTLVIRTLTSSNRLFQSHTAMPLKVPPFQTAFIRISFSPAATGHVNARLTLATNDPVQEELFVEMKGQGIEEAPVAVSPAFFNETLELGTKTTRQLTLTNNGAQPRRYRLRVMNSHLVGSEAPTPETGKEKRSGSDELQLARMHRLAEHQKKFAQKRSAPSRLVEPFLKPGRHTVTARENAAPAYKRGIKKYFTGFEEFNEGPVGEQHGWFAMQGWTIAGENAGNGIKHLRGISQPSGLGETYCLSPGIFDYDELYYPQYTTATLRLNVDKTKGTSWEVIPQDPWSYVATRIRFNPDGTMDALVIGNEYEAIWKRVPTTVPSGYFDMAIEYNNAGSDTSGFPTFYLFINNRHVFSGTGMASGIGQIAFVSPMETSGPVIDLDDVSVIGGEYVPPFLTPTPAEGTLLPGESATVSLEFDASIMKYGTYQSDLAIYLDETDSLRIPISLKIPGMASLWRDTYSLYMVLDKNEQGRQQVYLKNDGGEPVTFNFQHDIPGLTMKPQSGSLQVREECVIEFNFDGPPGMYQEEIAIHTSIRSEPEIMPATIVKYDSGAVFTAPDTLTVRATAGQISTGTIRLKNEGVNTVGYIAEVSSELSAFVTLDKQKAAITDSPVDIKITIDATALDPGTTTGNIRFLTNDPENRNIYTHVVINVVNDVAGHYIVQEVWSGIRGTNISSIPLDRPPSDTKELTLFQAPANTGDNYGSRIRGYIAPPVSGTYTFWIASNDNSELWLSTDENEANKIKIAWVAGYTNPGQWNKYPSQRSRTINLEANRKYYIEALHKEGVGTDHVSVGWQLPDGTTEKPIPAMRLFPFESDMCVASGTITREYWTGLRGTYVSDIPLNTAPDRTEVLALFEGPANVGTNYGARIRGYICPPETGEYYFWIASNDHSELWLSSDEDPANRKRIAYLTRATGPREWQKFGTQKSAAIFLTRGKRYYIEALHKQGIGTDHVSVGWQLPSGSLERPIAGARLSPFNVEDDQGAGDSFVRGSNNEPFIHAFPNPVTGDRLNVSIQAGPTGASALRDITIRDLTGQSVHRQRLDCADGCDVAVDVKDKLEPGVYLLQVTSGDGNIFTEKLIVR